MTNENEGNAPSANSDAQSPPSAPVQGALPDDGKRNSNEAKNEADELAREFRAAEKWVIGTNIVLAIIGILALCIYYGQLKAARNSVDTSRRTSEKDERAWLYIHSAAPPIAKSQIIKSSLTIINFGKTPARHITGFFYVEVLNRSKSPTFDYQAIRPFTAADVADMFPGQKNEPFTMRERMGVNGNAEDWPLEEAEYNDLIAGHSYIATYGKLKYEDIFGVKHWTEFCDYGLYSKYAGDYTTRECINTHNREDDNEEP